MNKAFLLPAFMFCIFLTACVPKIVPVPSQSGKIETESNIVTKIKGNIEVSVQSGEWHYQPLSVNDYFTPFLFLIRNKTGEKVPIKYNSFVLFDEHGNQYEAIPPDGIEYMLVARDVYGDSYPGMIFRYEETKSPYTFGYEVPAYLKKPMSNITILALPETSIYPDSQIRGFVYFRKASTYGKGLKLRVELNGFNDEFEFEIKK
ncbi:MAG: hypothetical protein PH343_02615 [Nitrospira sp.]|nr:hypothetical protein [Nitrospira sp.]